MVGPGKNIRSAYLARLGLTTSGDNSTRVPETPTVQPVSQGSVSQSLEPATPINLNSSPSSSPRRLDNLSVAEVAFAMELDVQGQGGGEYYVLNFCDKNSPAGRGGNI